MSGTVATNSQPAPHSIGVHPTSNVVPDINEDARSSQHSDVLDEILENYNFVCHPEVRLKFKQQLTGCSLSLSAAKPWQLRPRFRAVVKPASGTPISHVIGKVLAVPTHGQLCVYSSKIPLWFLRLQFMASYNWITQQPTLDYRLTTKWSEGTRLKHKERYHLGQNLLVRAKWRLDLQLPDLEGHIGGPEAMDMEVLDVDYGSMDFEINQVDVVLLSPWGRKKVEKEAVAAGKAINAAGSDIVSGSERLLQDSEGVPGRLRKDQDRNVETAGITRKRGWFGRGSRKERHDDRKDAMLEPQTVEQKLQREDVSSSTDAVTSLSKHTPAPLTESFGKQEQVMPEWLLNMLINMSVKPYKAAPQ